jgi:hypothetical protein
LVVDGRSGLENRIGLGDLGQCLAGSAALERFFALEASSDCASLETTGLSDGNAKANRSALYAFWRTLQNT